MELDIAEREFVKRIVDEAPTLVPDHVRLSAWLTAEGDGTIVVHIGTRRVGKLSRENSPYFAGHLAAAAVLDEQLLVAATVFRARGRDAIELDRPARGEVEE